VLLVGLEGPITVSLYITRIQFHNSVLALTTEIKDQLRLNIVITITLLAISWPARNIYTFLYELLYYIRTRLMTLHIPLTLYPRRGSRGISDIPPRRPSFTKII
jgi:hypothetical protein